MLETKVAYGFIIIAVILKTYGLYLLAGKKNKPFPERKKVYSKFNWSSNALLAIGIIILAIKWYI